MPSPWRIATCIECKRDWQTRSAKARTCSPKCRAQVREREHGPTKGAPPREYPQELVAEVCRLYESGMTRDEVQKAIGPGVKVEVILRRAGVEMRRPIPRDQSAERNGCWKGDAATYTALHLRVQVERGNPKCCNRCCANDPAIRYEWANLTGDYTDVNDYERMCVTCHRRYDADRRARTGARTSPVRR